jgi:chemotaxis protein MotB
MAREKPPAAGVPEWVLTYGDMMSLLLCFFIMLYSMSTLTVVKFQAVVESLQMQFGYQGSNKTPTKSTKTTTQRSTTAERSRRLAALQGGQPNINTVGEHKTVQNIRVKEVPIKGGLVWFELGSDELNEQAKEDIDAVLSTLIGSPQKIMIKGHAGVNELRGPNQQDIDLAYVRAVKVRDYLISQGLKPKFFQLVQVGAYEPLDRTVLPPGKSPQTINSVVEIMLLDKMPRDLQGNSHEEK